MAQFALESGAKRIVDKLFDAQSERSQRQAITSLVNFYFEMSTAGSVKHASDAKPVLDGILELIEDKQAYEKARLAALRSLSRIIADLPADTTRSSTICAVVDRITTVGRRRADSPAILEASRDLVNTLLAVPQSSTLDTKVELDTAVEICPLFRAIAQHHALLTQMHDELAKTVSSILTTSIDYRPATLDEGIEIAQRINSLGAQYGLLLIAKDGPSEPITLGFRKIGGTNPGAFIFRADGASRYAGVGLPALKAERPKSSD